MYFDRFDICEAYYLFSVLWHSGGMTSRDWERAKRRPNRRPESIDVQLSRIRFSPRMDITEDTLTENGRAIYDNLVAKYEGGQ